MKTKLTRLTTRAALALSTLTLALAAGSAAAEDAAAPAAAAPAAPPTRAEKMAPDYAKHLAIVWCSSCHGPAGRSISPLFPVLAAQSGEYLATQLKSFRALNQDDTKLTHETFYEQWMLNITGLRKQERYEDAPRNEERAWDFMKGVARDLDDATINALAAFFSSQKAVGGKTRADADTLAKGKALFDNGDMSKGLLPCQSCHGPDAHGNGPIPRLAGQHRDYVELQVKAIKSGVRNVDQMSPLIQSLTDADIKAVAAYVQSLD
jgi:cytochrome c553